MEEKLLIPTSTFNCATVNQCIPCLYKVFPRGYVVDGEENLQLPRNLRPECCPRSSSQTYFGLYKSNRRILTVGDGDLSFSLSIANVFYEKKQKKLNRLIATTHESLQSITETYHNMESILSSLQNFGVKLYHNIDATQFEQYSFLPENSLDIVIWNFPCIRVDKGADGQVSELELNQQLLRKFFQSVKYILQRNGEVHVTHKTIEPFSWWGLTQIAAEEGFQLYGQIVFDRWNYPGYINRKVLDKKSFPCHDARVSFILYIYYCHYHS
jgi:25S rRNA (uracil2634-N3)-methyltransferase